MDNIDQLAKLCATTPRLGMWSIALRGLKERLEDIAPNLDFELTRHAAAHNENVTFNKEARNRYLRFATSSDARWPANFRDLGASVTRMATFAQAGRIHEAVVEQEIERLWQAWRMDVASEDDDVLAELLPPERLLALDLFDAVQWAEVIRVCRTGRTLSAASRKSRTSSNDADGLKKYLARFGLTWDVLTLNHDRP
jgi:transcriptional regulatory protein RtcR